MATELAKAYVQIVPSADGIGDAISDALGDEATKSGETSGKSWSKKFLGSMKSMLSSGIQQVLTQSISAGSELQQSIGGIETMFGDSADKMKEYASQAYDTAGLSANDYMQQATSFSASLLQSLKGDTNAAAESANQAIVDMSDNANKFGSDISSIQSAYQGFAKQNYTMLDNLKLGYGGTKTEMERLLSEASKLSGQTYDISNLNDVYDAIHVVQKEMGVTGTTADEAAKTFSGSLASMKSAATNVLANLSLGEDISGPLNALSTTAGTFFSKNLIPMVINVLGTLPDAVISLLSAALPGIGDAVITGAADLMTRLGEQAPMLIETVLGLLQTFVSTVMSNLPTFVDAGMKMMQGIYTGIFDNIPTLITTVISMISVINESITTMLPQILESGAEILLSIISGISEAIPQLVDSIDDILTSIVDIIIDNLPLIINTGIKILIALIGGLIEAIPKLVSAIPQITDEIIDTFMEIDWLDLGKDILSGIGDGFKNAGSFLWDKIKSAANSIVDKFKGFLGIHSPSTVMKNQVGLFMGEGVVEGITDGMDGAEDAILGALPSGTAINSKIADALNGDYGISASANVKTSLVSSSSGAAAATVSIADNNAKTYALLQQYLPALANMSIILNDEKLGAFVTNTVEREVYAGV